MNQKVLSKEVSIKISVYMLVYIFIVVLFHSDLRYYYPFIEELTAVSTSYFFCVSAFFFYKGLCTENIGTRLKKRCITLLLPYLLWNLIYILLYFRIYQFSIGDIWIRLTTNPVCVPSWYLLTLFIFFLGSPFIIRALNNRYTAILLVIVGVAISLMGYVVFQRELANVPVVGGYLVRMAEYITPYLIGACIGTWYSEKINVGIRNCMIGVIISCVIILLLMSNIPLGFRWFMWICLPITLWEMVPERIFKRMTFLLMFTEPAFLLNMMHCYFLFLWGKIMSCNNLLTGKYLAVFIVGLAVFSSYVLYYLLKLCLPGVLKVLTGNRMKR